jgi:hypothetical protein
MHEPSQAQADSTYVIKDSRTKNSCHCTVSLLFDEKEFWDTSQTAPKKEEVCRVLK